MSASRPEQLAEIDEYRVLRPLGEGGMGAVYEAEHKGTGRRAAIKLIHAELAHDPAIEQRFVKEAMALSRVAHPGVVKILGFGFLQDGSSYLAMEFLQGRSLAHYWHETPNLDLLDELRRFYQLADVLAVLHSVGVIHRDLKPDNVVMLAPSQPGEKPRVKLIDFGLAKLIRLSGPQTQSALLMGTPAYMSPEQCRGAGHVDAKTDCYALGVMMFERLAGRLPFDSPFPGELIGMHLHVEPPSLSSLAPDVDARLAGLVHRMLSKDRALRPSMVTIAQELSALLNALGQPVEHRPVERQPATESATTQTVVDPIDPFAPTLAAAAPLRAGVLAPRFAAKRGRDAPASLAAPPPRALLISASERSLRRSKSPKAWQMAIGAFAIALFVWSLSVILAALRATNAQAHMPGEAGHLATQGGGANATHLVELADNDAVRLSGAIPQLPMPVSQRLPCAPIEGTYELTLDAQGSVVEVEPARSIPGADTTLMESIKKWRFKGGPRRIRQTLRVVPVAPDPSCPPQGQSVSVPLAWLAENMRGGIYLTPNIPKVRAESCSFRRVEYELCLNRAGQVLQAARTSPQGEPADRAYAGIDPLIIQSLLQWRFRQLSFPVCFSYPVVIQPSANDDVCAVGPSET